MKKLINRVEDVVTETLEGVARLHPERVRKLPGYHVLVRRDAPVPGKVGLIAGGGSGHEPAFWGCVGPGMMDAGVQGDVFTSPTPDHILAALKAVDGGAGVIQIYNNYTGDVMNFDMAQEMARAEGMKVDTIVVNDDVAVENSTYTVGRRGIAGNFFVQKIAGAAAARMMPFERVLAVGKKANENLRSMGMALTSCIVPAKGSPTFSLGEDEMEIGMGLHGEPGIERTKLRPANEVAELLVSKAADDFPLKGGETVAVLVNGLGATPLMELYIIGRAVAGYLAERGIKIYRSYVGEFATSMEMAGCSVSLLRLDDELISLLDYPADTLTFKQV
ncbi:MAG: phosphoenolpyruvate---glycerone phosphotransferase subunit DhaK [Bacillota bacterium]|jgi:dihydroxyacetone kinase-like protein|nr:phosphoenolpyruvate---glycerone phosphotransferase subunit DhaK [Bacillota bacterium]MDK2855210.1 phosphoenolpyruvate---glycerone phosphotransferase subunit DhaK [Bacillota bacterium]MDK2925522.1 phosphoenolpyruvate---glycerone phosphotransferase subunit DhaK [Bacillota bacterium]